jgi:hypothetical protein
VGVGVGVDVAGGSRSTSSVAGGVGGGSVDVARRRRGRGRVGGRRRASPAGSGAGLRSTSSVAGGVGYVEERVGHHGALGGASDRADPGHERGRSGSPSPSAAPGARLQGEAWERAIPERGRGRDGPTRPTPHAPRDGQGGHADVRWERDSARQRGRQRDDAMRSTQISPTCIGQRTIARAMARRR